MTVVVKANGNVYDGQWSKGLKHGEGVYVFREKGQYMEGIWINGVPQISVIKNVQDKQDVPAVEVTTSSRNLPEVILRRKYSGKKLFSSNSRIS